MLPVLEDFVKHLLKENIIDNYKADDKKVHGVYNKKYRKSTKMSFYNFKLELWMNWYVLDWSKSEIRFDNNWINYFKKLEEVLDQSNGKQYVTPTKCILCDVAFTREFSLEDHLKWNGHKIRMQYVSDKSFFNETTDILLEITQMSKNLRASTLKIEYPVQTDLNATLSITNNTDKEVNIMDVFIINPFIKDVRLQEDFDTGILLSPKKTIDINLHGYFENSASFIYPIIIITETKLSTKKSYHLKELHFEITSEFSSLKPDSQYQKSNAIETFKDMLDTIIPGEKPAMPEPSAYKETVALKQYKIPSQLNNQLNDLHKKYPRNLGKEVNPYYSSVLNIFPGINKNNYNSNSEKLLHIEEHQISIDIRDYDMVSTLQPVKGTTLYRLEIPGLAEERPSILVFDRVYLKERKNNRIKYEGYVHHVLEEAIHLGLNKRFDDTFVPNQKFHIEFGFNRRSIKVEKQALYLANLHGIIPCLFPSKTEIKLFSLSKMSLNFVNGQLNEEQKTAVDSILKHKNYPFVVFGPPGTGKTVTIVEAVYQLWKNYPNSKILICAPSNAAANEVANRLIEIIPKSDIFRLLGSFYSKLMEDGVNRLAGIMNISKDGYFYMPSMEDLLKRRILITTVITAARLVNGGAPTGHFSHVFIDESGYATETQTLIPLAGIISSEESLGKLTGQIILAGDPKQLGPRVHSGFAKYCGYGTSLLERLIKTNEIYAINECDSFNNHCVTKLVKNYRSHETILKVPNDLFYHGKLKAAGSDIINTFLGWEHLKNDKFPIIFHHVVGEDIREKNSPSFFNVQEIEVVVDYLQKLLSTRAKGIQIKKEHIGVITPYRKQAEKLRQACSKKNWNSILVGSVEQFQGKERMVVVMSTVRSKNVHKFEEIDQQCQLGFLKNPKRFNVALTRAKALLIVIGDANVLKTDNNWSTFIQYCVENKSVSGKRFNLSDNEE